jgi:hypothetical protein
MPDFGQGGFWQIPEGPHYSGLRDPPERPLEQSKHSPPECRSIRSSLGNIRRRRLSKLDDPPARFMEPSQMAECVRPSPITAPTRLAAGRKSSAKILNAHSAQSAGPGSVGEEFSASVCFLPASAEAREPLQVRRSIGKPITLLKEPSIFSLSDAPRHPVRHQPPALPAGGWKRG